MKKLAFVLATTLSSIGCTHLASVSMTPIPKERGTKVEAKSSRMFVLNLNFDNNYIDTLVNDLKTQCPGGMVKGILTKDEVVVYFPLIVSERRVTATGYCVKG